MLGAAPSTPTTLLSDVAHPAAIVPIRVSVSAADMSPEDGSLTIDDSSNQDNAVDLPLMSITTNDPTEHSVFATPTGTFQHVEVWTMSAPSSSAAPPSALQSRSEASSAQSPTRRRSQNSDPSSSIIDSSFLPSVEKETDDPSTPVPAETHMHTPTSLTRLLGGHIENSPDVSRQSSYKLGNANLLRRSVNLAGASLPDHLYTRGLLAGRHSDITIIAWGQRYNLHRIILDRAPFFANAFSEPWTESNSPEISLHPQAVDSSITQNAFDIAIKRLYGCDVSDEEDAEAIGLFAMGCWLEMQEIIDSAIDSILRQLTPENLGPIIRLVSSNYYGRPGERILSSAKAMLCRDGWDMSLKYWDAIPAEIAHEIVAGDGFFIHGEWERWMHARRLLDRRLKLYSLEFDLLKPTSKQQFAPACLLQWLPRFSSGFSSVSHPPSAGSDTDEDKWYSLYNHPEVEPFCKLLDTGIHYLHLEFEHLQYIRQSRDFFGLPVVPESVILNAIYMQLELRQKVVNAKDSDFELGLATPVPNQNNNASETEHDKISIEKIKSKGKAVEVTPKDNTASTSEPNQLDSHKYFIPSADCNMVMGGASEPVISTSPASTSLRMASRTDSDVAWIEGQDFDTSGMRPRPSTVKDLPVNQQRPPPLAFTEFPPFRFAASFPSPRLLKEKKRVYSRTVFYAGSLWNIYIQKMRSQRNFQLGVYLHRAKERDLSDDLTISRPPTSVDERIGLLEREMLLRGEQRSHRGRSSRIPGSTRQHRSSGSRTVVNQAVEGDASRLSTISSAPTAFSRDERSYPLSSTTTLQTFVSFDTDSSDSDSTLDPISSNPSTPKTTMDKNPFEDSPPRVPQPPFVQPRVPALPPYTDSRPTIRTYFKIYSPSKAGRLLSVYESAPDQFDFSQSWGWRSSTLMLDEGLDEAEDGANNKKGRNSGVLRFCIVLGNL
jgi:hypothetical protein